MQPIDLISHIPFPVYKFQPRVKFHLIPYAWDHLSKLVIARPSKINTETASRNFLEPAHY